MQDLVAPRTFGMQVGNVVLVAAGELPPAGEPAFDPHRQFPARDPATVRLCATRVTHGAVSGEPIHDDGSWAVHRTRSGSAFVLRNHIERRPEHEMLWLDLDSEGTGELRYRDGVPHHPVKWQSLDQMIVLDRLARSGGLMLHSAGLAGADAGLLLVGVSGAGKTTLSRAAAGVEGLRVLSDERVLARPTAGGWVIDGTPWPGDGLFWQQSTVPLRGVMLLEKADSDTVESLSPARALARLYACEFPAFWQADGRARSLEALERLVREVPCFRLRHRLGGAAPSLLAERLSA